MTPRKEKLLESLYTTCADRSLTSGDVFDQIAKDIGLTVSEIENFRDRAIDIIRPYKQTGKNLEATFDKLGDLLDMQF